MYPTCNCEVKETFFVVPTRLLCVRSLCGRHVVEDVLKKERFELFVRECRVTLARRIVEQRVVGQYSPWTQPGRERFKIATHMQKRQTII